MDQRQFTRTVDNFCEETRSARSQNRALNLDLRVLGLGAGGNSSASTNSTFTKYCREEHDQDYDARNYQLYLDGIDPGAYTAYAACTAAASTGVKFQLLPPTRDALHLVVSFPTNDRYTEAHMSWSAIGPVTCQWESLDEGDEGVVERGRRRVLAANGRTRLTCERGSYNSEPIREPDYVSVIRDGGDAVVNVPWLKYNEQGIPYETLDDIRRQLDTEIAGLKDEVERYLNRQWYNVTSLRQDDQCYVNNTDYPLEVAVSTSGRGNFCLVGVFVDGERILRQHDNNEDNGKSCAATFTVPPGTRYHVNDDGFKSGHIVSWWELRVGGNARELQEAQC